MRTMDPAIIRLTFNTQVQEILEFYNTVKPNLTNKSDMTRLAATTLISAATIWEGFVSDLFVAYINRDISQFVIHLEKSLEAGLTGKQKEIQSRYASFSAPKAIDKATVISLLDAGGNNITFPFAKEMKKGAKKWIAAPYRGGIIGLTSQQQATINLWIALRNHIAHDSERSRAALRTAVSNGGLGALGLHRAQRHVDAPGVYLKSLNRQPNGFPRIEVILDEMSTIAAAM